MFIARKHEVNFGSTDKVKFNTDGTFVGYYTKMFREDIDWDKFANYIQQTFPQGANCDIFGCSDGSEAYSLALKLKDSKYKIRASDFEPECIESAQNGQIHLTQEDLTAIESHTNDKWTSFFEKCPANNLYKAKQNLKDRIQFSLLDLTKGLEHYSFAEKTVCMIRNVWYHFNQDEKAKILKSLRELLPKSSTIVIGEQEELKNPKSFPVLVSEFFTPVSEFVNKHGSYVFRK